MRVTTGDSITSNIVILTISATVLMAMYLISSPEVLLYLVLAATFFLLNKKEMHAPEKLVALFIVAYIVPRCALFMSDIGRASTIVGEIEYESSYFVVNMFLLFGLSIQLARLTVSAQRRRPLSFSEPIPSDTVAIFCFLSCIASAPFVLFYIGLIGGIDGLVSSYDASAFKNIEKDGRISAVKNIILYCIVNASVAVAYLLYCKDKKKGILTLVSIYILVCSALFTKRTYIAMVLIPYFFSYGIFQEEKNYRKILIYAVAVFSSFVGLYVLRQFNVDGGYENLIEVLNSPEFWIYDQMVYVADNYKHLDFSSYPFDRFLLSLAAPFIEYGSVESVGAFLNKNSFSSSGWGIPPGIMGFVLDSSIQLFVVYSLALTILPVFFLDKAARNRRVKFLWFYLGCFSLIFIWEIVRLGDVFIVALHLNRYVIFAIVFYLFSFVLSRALKKLGTG